ncbi:MAG: cache domain-containing protein, partial [Deltaproteobacteria bacterium]|nr:cache domain-containing protein [Deltaproteobacteria bacterium]
MEEDAYHLARLASREHAHQIEGARTLLRWIGDRLSNQPVVIAGQGFLSALLAGYPQLANIGILSPEGKVLRSAYPLPSFPNMADNPAFVRAQQSNEVEAGNYIIGPIVGRPVLNLAYAIRRPGGSIRQVVFVALDLRWLDDLARQVNLPPGYSLLVVDRDGRVLAHSGEEIRGSAASRGKLIPGLADLPNQRGGKILKVSGNQPPQFFVGARMAEIPGISVAVGLPYEHIYREANLAFFRTLGGLALLTLITAVSVLVATELSILRSLRTLSRTARRFGGGELLARA